MNRFRIKTGLSLLAGGAILSFIWHGGLACAETPLLGTATNFTMSEYYSSPHDLQMKSLISGREAQPQAGGRYVIKGLRIETFDENGARQAVVEAPECVYDGAKRVASSASHLRVVSGRGQFVVEGEGFLWQQDESKLLISNRVHTIVRDNTIMPAGDQNASPRGGNADSRAKP